MTGPVDASALGSSSAGEIDWRAVPYGRPTPERSALPEIVR